MHQHIHPGRVGGNQPGAGMINGRLLNPKTVPDIPLDGRYVLIRSAVSPYYMYLSTDGGASFSGTGMALASGLYLKACISDDGQYMIVSGYATTSHVIIGSSDYGATWGTIYATTGRYGGSIVSDTGQYQFASVAGGSYNNRVYRSTNYGSTWGYRTMSQAMSNAKIAASASGQYVYISNDGGLYPQRSADYGYTWNPVTLVSTDAQGGIGVSGTGQHVIVVYNTGIARQGFLSTNYGVSWSYITSQNMTTASHPEISRSGQYMAYVESNFGSQVYYSSNYGSSWSDITSGLPVGGMMLFSHDASIRYLQSGSGLYKSTNGGSSWMNMNVGFSHSLLAINKSAA